MKPDLIICAAAAFVFGAAAADARCEAPAVTHPAGEQPESSGTAGPHPLVMASACRLRLVGSGIATTALQ